MDPKKDVELEVIRPKLRDWPGRQTKRVSFSAPTTAGIGLLVEARVEGKLGRELHRGNSTVMPSNISSTSFFGLGQSTVRKSFNNKRCSAGQTYLGEESQRSSVDHRGAGGWSV